MSNSIVFRNLLSVCLILWCVDIFPLKMTPYVLPTHKKTNLYETALIKRFKFGIVAGDGLVM